MRSSRSSSRCSSRATSSSTAATRTIPDTDAPHPGRSKAQGLLLHRHRRLRRRGRRAARARRSCPAATRPPGRTSSRSSRPSPPRSPTARRAATGSGPRAPATTSRWSTTASNTATCSSSARPTTCCSRVLGLDADELHEVFAEWNKGELDSYLIEITRDIFGYKRPGDRQAAGRPDPRHRRPEGHRQVDGRIAPRPGRAADADRRGRLRPLPVGPEGRARRRREGAARAPSRSFTGDRAGVHRRRRAGALRQQDHLLRPGLRADAARWRKESSWDDQQRRHRPDVARRLHHPQRLPGQDQGGLRPQPEAGEPAARSVLRRARSSGPQAGWRRVVGAGGRPAASRCRP